MPIRRLSKYLAAGLGLAFVAMSSVTVFAAESRTVHGLSLFGDLKYGPDFSRFDYVNPDAPKGGTLRLSAIGGFDSLNPFVIKGKPGAGSSLIYDRLVAQSQDEAAAEYGLLAESIELPDDFSWVIFNLRPEARWHDGKPVTPEDVIFSFNALTTEGAPIYRYYYANVVKAEKVGPRAVRFSFDSSGNRELPRLWASYPSCRSITGGSGIFPRPHWSRRWAAAPTASNRWSPVGS